MKNKKSDAVRLEELRWQFAEEYSKKYSEWDAFGILADPKLFRVIDKRACEALQAEKNDRLLAEEKERQKAEMLARVGQVVETPEEVSVEPDEEEVSKPAEEQTGEENCTIVPPSVTELSLAERLIADLSKETDLVEHWIAFFVHFASALNKWKRAAKRESGGEYDDVFAKGINDRVVLVTTLSHYLWEEFKIQTGTPASQLGEEDQHYFQKAYKVICDRGWVSFLFPPDVVELKKNQLSNKGVKEVSEDVQRKRGEKQAFKERLTGFIVKNAPDKNEKEAQTIANRLVKKYGHMFTFDEIFFEAAVGKVLNIAQTDKEWEKCELDELTKYYIKWAWSARAEVNEAVIFRLEEKAKKTKGEKGGKKGKDKK